MLYNRRSILIAVTGAAFWPAAWAEGWPRKPVRVILNFPAGGPGDVVTRYVAQRMSALLGQQVIVENRSGGAGAVGILAVANAQADGYTFLYTTVTGVVQVPLITKDQTFDPLRSVIPVMGVGSTPMGLFVHAGSPATDFPSFLDWARKQAAGLDIGGVAPSSRSQRPCLREARTRSSCMCHFGEPHRWSRPRWPATSRPSSARRRP